MSSVPGRPTSSFEHEFHSQTLRRTILRLGDRAPLLTCASAAVCKALSPLRTNPQRLIDLADVLVEGAAFAAASAIRREEVLKTISEFVTTLFGGADTGDPERWIEALNWTITAEGCIIRRDTREMLVQWKKDTPELTGRTLLERLATLRPHFRPKLLRFIAAKDVLTDRLIVVTLHDLCRPSDVAWPEPVRAALGLAAGTAAPGFGDLLSDVLRTAIYESPPPSPIILDTLNENALRIFRFVRQMKDGATVPSAAASSTAAAVSSTAPRLTATQCCQLLALLPRTVCGGLGQKLNVQARIDTLFRFIRDGVTFGVAWENVLTALANFIRANRVTYLLTSDTNPGIEGAAEHEVTFASGDDRIRLIATRIRVTFFAEAHTYACADLRNGVVDRATQITFWPVEFTRVEVAAAVGRLLQHARVQQLARDSLSGPVRYRKDVIDGFEVGVELRGSEVMANGNTLWRVYLTHLSPSPGTNILATELKVVRLLLLRYPDA